MTDKWVRDTGLIFALVALFFAFTGSREAIIIAAVLVFTVAFFPAVLRPFAWVWLKIAQILGFVMNHIFFGLVFFIIVTPVGLLKRVFTGDSRALGKNKNSESVFVARNSLVQASDLVQPF